MRTVYKVLCCSELNHILVLCFREQLMFPFHFLDRLGKHDVTCTVSGGGRSAQAGAIRLAMARALCSFVTEEEVEWMRQGMRCCGREVFVLFMCFLPAFSEKTVHCAALQFAAFSFHAPEL